VRIKATAKNGGVYVVFVDDVEVSRHNSWHKAMESATNAKLSDPTKTVVVKQGLEIVFEAVADPVQKPLLGVYTSNVVVATERNNLPPIFEGWLGRQVDYVLDFDNHDRGWFSVGADWVLSKWETWMQSNPRANFMMTAQMFPSKKEDGVTPAGESFDTVIAGAGDAAFQRFADKLIEFGFPNALIRIGHEMDGSWKGIYSARGVEAKWAAAFRRMVDVMRARQPTANWKFGICPTQEYTNLGAGWLEKVYPGNAHVDWIGLDIYDTHWSLYPQLPSLSEEQRLPIWQQQWATWCLPSLNGIRDFAKTKGKPVSIPEWGSHWRRHTGEQRGGMDNPIFMEQMCKWILDPNNVVVHHCYYNASKPSFDPNSTSLTDDQWTARLGAPYQNVPGDTLPTFFPKAGEIYRSYFA
jgi:hypothetical protein